MKTLALDVGDKRIGLAVSDGLGIVAAPLSVYQRSSQVQDVEAMVRFAREQAAQEILVGVPLPLSGPVSAQASRVLRFVDALTAVSPIPIQTCDERLSTVEADRLLAGKGPREKRRGMRDAVAACVFLQSYLDTQALMLGRAGRSPSPQT